MDFLSGGYLLICLMPEKIIRLSLTLCLLCVFTFLLSCKASDKPQRQTGTPLDELIKSRLGPKYELDHNVSKTHVLCRQQREGDHSRRIFKYIVVRLSDSKVLQEGSYNGHAKWNDDKSIEVLNVSSKKASDSYVEKTIINVISPQY